MVEFKTTIILVSYGVQPLKLRWTQRKTGLYNRVLSMLPRDHCKLCCKRGQNGVYGGSMLAFEEKKTSHRQTGQKKPRYDSSTIKEWSAAPFNVRGISRFDIETAIMASSQKVVKGFHLYVEFELQRRSDSLGCLTNLQTRLVGPLSLGCLTNLQTLDLSGCSQLKRLPDSLGSLTSLQSLSCTATPSCNGSQILLAA